MLRAALASLRRADRWVRPYTSLEQKSDGYYVGDGEDRGGGWDLELREYGEGGAGGDYARHRYAD